MARFLYHLFCSPQRKVSTIILALFWISGLILGCLCHLHCGNNTVSMMYGAMDGTVSIVSLLSVILLPFLFSVLTVYFFKPNLLAILVFCKGFSLCFVGCGILSAYCSAGWLAQFLLMFSDLCTLPLLWLFWLRHPGREGQSFRIETCLLMALACLVCCLDYCFISPITVVL